MYKIDRISKLILSLAIGCVGTGLINSERVRSNEESADKPKAYPHKTIASKQVTGRFREFVWGDYLYAKFDVNNQDIFFFVGGMESCFLKKYKYRGKKINVSYNVTDIYLPQASGYHRVNLIKKIDGVDIEKWGKSQSRSQVKQCTSDDYR
jgi:hypothetical protein